MSNRRCILGITTAAMEMALQLPDNARIVAVQQPFNSPGVIQIHVEGLGAETSDRVPLVHLPLNVEVSRGDDGHTIVDWHFEVWEPDA